MKKKQIPQITSLIFLIGALTFTSFGQLSFTTNSTITIDFSTTIAGVNNGAFNSAGFTPAPGVGQLDSDAWAVSGMSDGNLAFGGTQNTGDFARGTSTGGVTTGGFYAYSISVGAFTQPTGTDFNPGTITLRIQNNGPTNITQFTVDYDILVNNDQGRSNSFDFSHSPDNTTYTPVPAVDYASPVAADALGFQTVNRNTVITGLNVTPGSFFYLRWSSRDISGSGSRDELGFDNIAVSALFAPTAASGSVSGRILNEKARGLRFVTVMITGGTLPEPLYATTNQFGRYQFEDIPVGDTYVLQVFSKRYTFKQSSLVFNLDDNITNADFIGFER